MHCEDHGRDDLVLPYGHHQGVHQQPLPICAHLQTEEHQQIGADPAQTRATIQVSCINKLCKADNMSEWWLSKRGIWTQ